MGQVTEKQISYIETLKRKAGSNLEYSADGWGFTPKNVCESMGIMVLRGKMDLYKVLADALAVKFQNYLGSLNAEMSKEQASQVIDTLKNGSWLELSKDTAERAAQLNEMAGSEIVESRENARGKLKVYAK